jgi:hypothetical protein
MSAIKGHKRNQLPQVRRRNEKESEDNMIEANEKQASNQPAQRATAGNVIDGVGFSEGEYVKVRPESIPSYLEYGPMGSITYGFLKWVLETSTFVVARRYERAGYYEIAVLNDEGYRFWVRGRDLTREGLPKMIVMGEF